MHKTSIAQTAMGFHIYFKRILIFRFVPDMIMCVTSHHRTVVHNKKINTLYATTQPLDYEEAMTKITYLSDTKVSWPKTP